ALAQEASKPSAAKGEIKSGFQQIKAQRNTIHENAQAAREEEKQLKQQIEEAVAAGDHKTAKKLRDQLHATHQKNVAEMHQNKQLMQEAKQELRSEIKDARQQGQLPPKGVNLPGTGPVVKDKLENIRDRKEDAKDRREDVRDRREDIRDKGNIHDRGFHKGDDAGIRDRGKGVGTGKGQGVGKDHMGGGNRGGGGKRR
ncbi:MAG: hypothetical protein AAB221_02680, partial [Bacteroidota bacterium]